MALHLSDAPARAWVITLQVGVWGCRKLPMLETRGLSQGRVEASIIFVVVILLAERNGLAVHHCRSCAQESEVAGAV